MSNYNYKNGCKCSVQFPSTPIINSEHTISSVRISGITNPKAHLISTE